MQKKVRVSLHDLEEESKKFLAPTTDKERSIIEAAVELLSERGIDGATTAEIAKRAGVTEKTLFRYFPSKRDLVRRVLFPLLERGGLSRKWEAFEALLKTKEGDFRSWYVTLAADRLANISRNPGLSRTVLTEVLQNEEFRQSIEKLWHRHVWQPMVESLEGLQANGVIRKDVDVEVLARAIHCLHIGYFLVRHVFAPDRNWDDPAEIEKMAEILTRGSSDARRA
jgi:TetR/AcrR family transcriptional regulator